MNLDEGKRVNLPVRSKGRRQRVAPHRLLAEAEAALRLGEVASAARKARRVLAQYPDHLSAWELLARACWQSGFFEKVVAALDRALALNPYEPGYHALKGSALQSMGRYGEATEAFHRARELPGCEAAIRELQDWQAALVGDLLKIDPVFRVSYAQDPEGACAARGFVFVQASPLQWRAGVVDRVWAFTRPS